MNEINLDTCCATPDSDVEREAVTGPEADAELAILAKALAHPVRIQVVRMLARRSGCVFGDIASELPLAQSTVSQHLKILREAGLIRGDVEGPHVCYCLEPRVLRRLKGLVAEL